MVNHIQKEIETLTNIYNEELDRFWNSSTIVVFIEASKSQMKKELIDYLFTLSEIQFDVHEIETIIDQVYRYGEIRTQDVLTKMIIHLQAKSLEEYQQKDCKNKYYRQILLNTFHPDYEMHPFVDLANRIGEEIFNRLREQNEEKLTFTQNWDAIKKVTKTMVEKQKEKLVEDVYQQLKNTNMHIENTIEGVYKTFLEKIKEIDQVASKLDLSAEIFSDDSNQDVMNDTSEPIQSVSYLNYPDLTSMSVNLESESPKTDFSYLPNPHLSNPYMSIFDFAPSHSVEDVEKDFSGGIL